MKYIVDIDALKDCIGLLPREAVIQNIDKTRIPCISLYKIIDMIDKFPKDKVKGESYDS